MSYSWPQLLSICFFGVFIAAAGLAGCGYLARRRGTPTGYTRKIFHALIFLSAAGINGRFGFAGVLAFGAGASLPLFYALLRGDGHLFYEAIAREKDRPHRSFYILIPYLATVAGGVLNNWLFPGGVTIGYLITGAADAIAEPVGVRFGRRRYRAPGWGVSAERSWEGSLSVFLASLVILSAAAVFQPEFSLGVAQLTVILAMSILISLVEAISPHGWDNFTLQLVPAAMWSLFWN